MSRPTFDTLTLARAPRDDVPLTFDGPKGYRPRVRSRYWRMGGYVVEEDYIGACTVLSRASLERLSANGLDGARFLDAAPPDAAVAGIEKAIRAWGNLFPEKMRRGKSRP